MKNGDAFSKKFGGETGNDPDWFLLTIEGFDSNYKSTGKVYFNLADFAYSNNANDYIVNNWKWVDLSRLGRISKLEFSLRSSDNGTWGMNTPGYFCIDNLNQQIVTSAPQLQDLKATVYPNPFTDRIIISGISETAKATITDLSGRKIVELTEVTNNQMITGLEELPAGVYILKLEEGAKVFSQKLIKR
jgi:hypothetical protein